MMNKIKLIVVSLGVLGGVGLAVSSYASTRYGAPIPQPRIPCVTAPCRYTQPSYKPSVAVRPPYIPCVTGACRYPQQFYGRPHFQPQPRIPCVTGPCYYFNNLYNYPY